MKNVYRLPVQHPEKPHCPSCGVDLPVLDGLVVEFANDPLLQNLGQFHAVVIVVDCECGYELRMTKHVGERLTTHGR